jgi:outer membrane biosynthesis protein TonB
MRVGVAFSLALHAAIIAAGLVTAPSIAPPPSPMRLLPVELLEISDTTNVAPVYAEPEPEAPLAEETASETASPAAAAVDPEPIETLPSPPEAKPEPEIRKPPPPKPKAAEPEALEDTLEGVLKSVEKNRSKRPAQQKTAADIRQVTDAAPRSGVGDNRRMTVTVADFIRSQLIAKGCWNDQDDMADARRLRAVIRIRFERDGRLMGAPELREPARLPAGDPPMQIFTQKAFRALNMCSPFTVPPEYYAVSPAQWIDIEFVP